MVAKGLYLNSSGDNWRASEASETLLVVVQWKTDTYVHIYILEEKTFKNVKNGFRVALKYTETRKSQPYPLRIGWASLDSVDTCGGDSSSKAVDMVKIAYLYVRE